MKEMSANSVMLGPQPQQSQKHYGITSPISLAYPKDVDDSSTRRLIEALKPFGVFEEEEELNHRLVVLGKLNNLVKEWIAEISETKLLRSYATSGILAVLHWIFAGFLQRGREVGELCGFFFLWQGKPAVFTSHQGFCCVLSPKTSSTGGFQTTSQVVGLVESKIRVLVGNLERNDYITLAHVNPQSFPGLKEHHNLDDYVTIWFIGIIFKKVENAESVNIDLTQDIQLFTDTVYRQANNINMLKEKMRIEATHVKKKQLHQYLPAEILQKKKKQSIPDNRNTAGNVGNLNRTSLEGNPLDSSRDTDAGTPFGSPALSQKSSKPNILGTEDLQINSISPGKVQVSDVTKLMSNEGASPETQLDQVKSRPVIGAKNDPVSTANPTPSQALCTIPTVVGRSVIPRLASPPCNQPLPNGTKLNPSPNSSSSKRPHSPTLEESPKRLKDLQLICAIEPDDSAFKRPYPSNEEDGQKSEKDGQDNHEEVKSMPIPTIDRRSQRLPSKELPDASSPVPTSSIRVIKNSIRLTLNR
ncbi:poly(A) polymerase gamma-like [Heterodontus francisci]|uniref:poly(A) polymerase gamma-like n=1 Tax=Heterodontus francisci TaxID=7792 RepID=UPI00355C10C6